MKFEWDAVKAAANIRKHGVSVEEAASVLRDDFAATARDLEHSVSEFRFITFGVSARGDYLRWLTPSVETLFESSVPG